MQEDAVWQSTQYMGLGVEIKQGEAVVCLVMDDSTEEMVFSLGLEGKIRVFQRNKYSLE